jgi:hypothetical protein
VGTGPGEDVDDEDEEEGEGEAVDEGEVVPWDHLADMDVDSSSQQLAGKDADLSLGDLSL